jgi:prepilin-type N-terminal cleavage/methylation domain-containing protein
LAQPQLAHSARQAAREKFKPFERHPIMFRNNKAFTLIELMVVIVIIGILATLAIPKFNEASVKAKVAEAPSVLSSYDNAQLAYLAETNALGTLTNLVFKAPGTAANGVTKYYTYSETYAKANTTVAYGGQAAASGMGDVVSLWILTTIDNTQQLTHSAHANYAKYAPNWK